MDKPEKEADVLAKALMREIMHDNGAINAREPDGHKRYPAKHVAAIGAAAKAFFDHYHGMLNDETICEMANGGLDITTEPLGAALDRAMNDYFNNGL